MADAEAVRQYIVEFLSRAAASKGMNAVEAATHTHMVDSGLLDSFAFLELLAALEARFDAELDLADADPDVFLRIGGLAALVSSAARGG